jgi:hypothetical protein
MGTKVYKFFGTAKWAKVLPKQLDLNYDKTSKSWKIDLYMTEGSLALYRQSGLQLKERSDADGTFVQFRRPERKIIKGEVIDMSPPYVVTADDAPLEEEVGNGSKVAVEVEVYDSMKGKGHTLVGVTVHELVPYSSEKKILQEEVPW